MDKIAAAIRLALREESKFNLARFDWFGRGERASRRFGPFGGGLTKPIKPFSKVRTESVLEQLAGKSEGLISGGGFMGGGPGGGGPSGFGLGMMLSRPFLKTLDANQDSWVTEAEFTQGFGRLFDAWNTDKTGRLTLQQLRSGLDKDLAPSFDGFSPFGGGNGSPRGPGGGFGGPAPNRPEQRSTTRTPEPRP